ncbi:MAG: hypothetical protein KME32_14445 [Mojavia pulchra JT2-VF2]|uniref:Uncharacterized protein n=1 Tax=Mojavia pulchra JT2-VF2 TaxID=287848 RepID=A0A951UGR2_9NOST|nr:hypothetical protein [Mojavia pulchra JT2-VF2]
MGFGYIGCCELECEAIAYGGYRYILDWAQMHVVLVAIEPYYELAS